MSKNDSINLAAIKGMNDILPQDINLWHFFEKTSKQCLEQFSFSEMRTPILEHTQVFIRGIGKVTDIVEKEMYSFNDALNGESLTLRPEGTAAAVRCVNEHHMLYDGPKKLWYTGPMFRHERPQRGRYRQFHQLGLESLGYYSPQADIELIIFANELFKKLGIIDKLELHINSLGDMHEREKHREALVEYFNAHKNSLDEDSIKRLRTNPLRILDSKNASMQTLIEKAPKITHFLEEASKAHFQYITNTLDALNISYKINNRLVRGLDYYNRTVFEWITSELGAQGTVCGGGRYDPLIKLMGGKPAPAVGLAMGIERILELIKLTNYPQASKIDAYIIHNDASFNILAFQLALKLRNISKGNNLKILQHISPDIAEPQSIKAQIKKANALMAKYAIIIDGDISVKCLANGHEQNFVLNVDDDNTLAIYEYILSGSN
jgi:histidyl-tRNA synthetase